MKSLSLIALLAAVSFIQPATAKTLWTNISDTAPRSVFDDIRDTAPRSVFDDIRDAAPRSVFDGLNDSAPLAPVFDTLGDKAP